MKKNLIALALLAAFATAAHADDTAGWAGGGLVSMPVVSHSETTQNDTPADSASSAHVIGVGVGTLAASSVLGGASAGMPGVAVASQKPAAPENYAVSSTDTAVGIGAGAHGATFQFDHLLDSLSGDRYTVAIGAETFAALIRTPNGVDAASQQPASTTRTVQFADLNSTVRFQIFADGDYELAVKVKAGAQVSTSESGGFGTPKVAGLVGAGVEAYFDKPQILIGLQVLHSAGGNQDDETMLSVARAF
jgi:hypothetical protein